METCGKILLICDDVSCSGYMNEQLLGLGSNSVSIENTAAGGISNLKHNNYEIIFIKYGVPQTDMASLLGELKKIDPDAVIIILYEMGEDEKLKELSELGAFDFINRQVDKEKLKFLVEKGIKLHVLLAASRRFSLGLKENNQALEKQNMLLARRIEEATTNLSRLYESLRSTYMRTIKVLAQAIDARDHYTHSHSENVSRYAIIIANFMRLPAKEIELLRQACELHDLGKIGIEDSILLKPGPLTDVEWEQIKKHPTIGAQILEPLTFLNGVVDLVRQHHEHYDGSGYPEGRKGEDILLGARIIHVADAYEAMRSPRSYRQVPFTKEAAVLEIKRNSGTQFDPKIVEAFLQVADNL